MKTGEPEGAPRTVSSALEAVTDAAEKTAEDGHELARQSRQVQAERAGGASVREMMAAGGPQRALNLAGSITRRLLAVTSRLRKVLVSELAADGAGVAAISRLFGVSHQRISVLLKKDRGRRSG
jgi:hypothetical protein